MRTRLRALLLLLLLLPVAAFADPLLAKVFPAWSPFVSTPVKDPTGMIGEARKMIFTDPARVAEVLKGAGNALDREQKRMVDGLLADALYQRGGNSLYEASRAYRVIITGNPDPSDVSWLRFMEGNVRKIMGYTAEARYSYEEVLRGAEKPWTASAIFNLGVIALETGDNLTAVNYFEDWLGRYRGQAGTALVLYCLVEAYSEVRDPVRALAAYDEAKRLEPDGWLVRPEIGYRISEELQAVGKLEEAATELAKLGKTAPGTAEGGKSRLAIGEMWVQKGRIDQAARVYAELVDEKPGADQLEEVQLRLALLGVLYSDEIELTEPFPAYKEFYRPEQRFLEILAKSRSSERKQLAEFGMGELWKKRGEIDKSLEAYARAFQKYPQTPMSGRAYEHFLETVEKGMQEELDRADFAGAARLFETYLPTARWSPQRDLGLMHFLAGKAYVGLGSVTQGKKMLEDALYMGTPAVEPALIREELAKIQVREKDATAMVEWVRTHPDDLAMKLELARKLAARGESPAARELFAEVIKKTDDPAQKLNLIRESDRLAKADVDTALKALGSRRTILAKSPESAGNAEDLQEARLRFAAGEYAKAIPLLEKLNLAPEDRYILALSYRATGREEMALNLFKSIKESNPDPLTADLVKFHLEMAELSAKEGAKTKPLPASGAKK